MELKASQILNFLTYSPAPSDAHPSFLRKGGR